MDILKLVSKKIQCWISAVTKMVWLWSKWAARGSHAGDGGGMQAKHSFIITQGIPSNNHIPWFSLLARAPGSFHERF